MIEVAAEVKYWIAENNRGVFSLGQSRKVVKIWAGPSRIMGLLSKEVTKNFTYLFDCPVACGILVSQPGLNLWPLDWKLQVLTTEPPGNS